MTQGLAIATAAALLGTGVPWLGIRMLVPTLEEGRKVTNYRGREVFLGLGIAWLLWAGAAIIGGALPSVIGPGTGPTTILPVAGLLALVAFALGMVDDAYGSSAARGFSGHLKALARGRLTTGGMKLFGISLACYIVAIIVIGARGGSEEQVGIGLLLWALPAGAGIALTSNFVNLTDLRPGRALKTYSLLALFGVLSSAVGILWMRAQNSSAAPPFDMSQAAFAALVLAIFAYGPVLAVWRYDLGERGMLGDAGANPMGAVAGLLIVAGLPLWGTLVYFVFMLALNLASERVSFSKVIDGNAFLRRLDAVGREPDR